MNLSTLFSTQELQELENAHREHGARDPSCALCWVDQPDTQAAAARLWIELRLLRRVASEAQK